MAIPDSLQAWREFVAAQPDDPAVLTLDQLAALTEDEKTAYDEQRAAFLGSNIVLATPDTEAIELNTRLLVNTLTSKKFTARPGLAVSGESTLGKSTATLWVAREHERRVRRRQNREDDLTFAPVVYVPTPAGTTPKGLMVAFCNWPGLPMHRQATAQELTEQVIGVLRELGTSLVLLDEIHNMKTRSTLGADAASAVKGFAERLDALFVYVGIDLPNSDLFTGSIGKQLSGRVTMYQMQSFGNATEDQRADWAELVDEVEALLPLAAHQPGTLNPLAGYLYDRTGGSHRLAPAAHCAGCATCHARRHRARHLGHVGSGAARHERGREPRRQRRARQAPRARCGEARSMTLRPLPVPTRLYDGEDVTTYATRASTRNGAGDRGLDKALFSLWVVNSVARRAPDRLQAWRELGNLHADAFTTPTVIDGEWVTDRALCRQCTEGHPARGRLPRLGLVCVRHRRWLADGQPRVDAYPAALTAERHFRARLAARAILFDSAPMRIGAECARVALSPAMVAARQNATGLPVDAVLYPEQVAFARLLTRPDLFTATPRRAADPATIRQRLDTECRKMVPATDENEPWRASTRLQGVLFALRSQALDSTKRGQPDQCRVRPPRDKRDGAALGQRRRLPRPNPSGLEARERHRRVGLQQPL